MKQKKRFILLLISSIGIFCVGLEGLLTSSYTSLFTQYALIIGGGIGVIGNAIELFVEEMEKELAEINGLTELKVPIVADIAALQELTSEVLKGQ